MSDTNIAQLIKRIAKEAWEAEKLADTVIGTVISINPLKIQTDQKIILEEQFITVSESLKNYETEVSFIDGSIIQGIDSKREDEIIWDRREVRYSPPVKHKVIIHNALKQGDIVILARMAGGQHYFVLDRKGD